MTNLLKDQSFTEHLTNLEIVNDLPKGLLSSMMKQESGGNPNAVSNKGARGAFQFIPSTAKAYGVDVTDPYSSADGAARYMADNLKKYNGSVEASLADYNGGPRQAKAVIETGTPRALETKGYIRNIMASMNPISSAYAGDQPLKNTTPTGYNKPANNISDEDAIAWLDAQKAAKPVPKTPTDDEAIAWLDAQKAKTVQRTPEQIAASQRAKQELIDHPYQPTDSNAPIFKYTSGDEMSNMGLLDRAKASVGNMAHTGEMFTRGVGQSAMDTAGALGYGTAKISDALGITDNQASKVSEGNKLIEQNYQGKTPGSIAAGLGRVAGTVGQVVATPVIEAPAILGKPATMFPKATAMIENSPVAARVAQNAAIGAGFGAAGTKTDDESYLQNAAVGAVAGPLLGEAVNRFAAPVGNATKAGWQKLAQKWEELGLPTPSAANAVNATDDASRFVKQAVNGLNDAAFSGSGARKQLQSAVVDQVNKPIGVIDQTTVRPQHYEALPNAFNDYDTAIKNIPVQFDPAKANVIEKLGNEYSNISANPDRSVLATLERAKENYLPDPATNFPRSLKAPEVDRMVKDVALARDSIPGEAGQALEGIRKLYTDTLHQGIGADNVKLREAADALHKNQLYAQALADKSKANSSGLPNINNLNSVVKNAPDRMKDITRELVAAKELETTTNPLSNLVTRGALKALAHGSHLGLTGGATIPATLATEGLNIALQSHNPKIAKFMTGNTQLQQMLNKGSTNKAAIMAALLANRIKNNK